MLSASVRSALLCVTALAAVLAVPAVAGAASAPPARTVAHDGPTGRYLLDGGWQYRADPHQRGDGYRWSLPRAPRSGWKTVSVPNAFNANDLSNRSMAGTVAWYRKDFRLPAKASDWLVRFESVRYQADVWLNGNYLGQHEGGFLPWELHLRGLKKGNNRLAIRVSNKQHRTDLPPGKMTIVGAPSGGWWNWGGILRDVYLRRVNGIDISQAQVLPDLPCRTCDAAINYRVTVRNYRRKAARVRVTSRFGTQRITLGTVRVAGGGSRQVRARLTVPSPRLWSPDDPQLYDVSINATGHGSAGWSLHSGIRSLKVVDGQLQLNGVPTHFRGVFMHEDDPVNAGAISTQRMELLIRLAKDLGATVLRTHYPLNPYLHELADREGLMIWSEIPVFQVPSAILDKPEVRSLAAQMLRENILANGNHPSVFAWSLGNELNPEPDSRVSKYFRDGARLAHKLDPTRPVGLAIQGYPGAGCQSGPYAPLDILGVNTYFGWYPGPNGSIADRTQLGKYLDQVRGCYQKQAIAVTEFGAEANRDGPPEDRGTYEFQSELNDFDLQTYATKPWLSGAIGMEIEFRVRPGWSGGNPYPSPPMHQKGVFSFTGEPKPAAAVLRRWFTETQQYDAPQP